MSHRRAAVQPQWTPFVRMDTWIDRNGGEPIPDWLAVYNNSRYSVTASLVDAPPPFGDVVWLSIKRRDRRQIHDWRDLQRIKNEIVGPQIEAVEIYPAEARLVDTSNQYHLWCFLNGLILPFGYADRRIGVGSVGGSKQRPFERDATPADAADVTVMAQTLPAERISAPRKMSAPLTLYADRAEAERDQRGARDRDYYPEHD